MNFNDLINNPTLKKVTGIASIALAGIVAVSNAIGQQKKEKEFEELKKTVSELQKK